MKVVIIENYRLHMEPENERDQTVCERLIANEWVTGFGRDSLTRKVIHVQVPLGNIDPERS